MIKNLRRGLAATALAFAVLAPASSAHADEYTLTEAITSLSIADGDPRWLRARALSALEGR
ncbi:hypothetical protein [Streptomyces sp. LN245]|uniref:hypothetical protein n=1 Tax=Streptomyces sp. LN245 TaxID=3112975 RepID=UPI0037145EC8